MSTFVSKLSAKDCGVEMDGGQAPAHGPFWPSAPFFLALLLLGFSVGCGKESPSTGASLATGAPPLWFEDITERVGLHFVQDVEVSGNYKIPEQIGSGGALFDYDNDGNLDL